MLHETSALSELEDGFHRAKAEYEEDKNVRTWAVLIAAQRAYEEALFPEGTATGVRDVQGRMIRVGDRIEMRWNDAYPRVEGMVRYDVELSAFRAVVNLGRSEGWPSLRSEMRIIESTAVPS
jgi:hypothetical protein